MAVAPAEAPLDAPDVWNPPLAASRLREMLEDVRLQDAHRLVLADTRGGVRVQVDRVAETAATDASGLPGSPSGEVEVSAPVEVAGQVVATVRISGLAAAQPALEETTRLLALRLSDAWAATYEIDNLSSEILHSYDELHLLYELGETLNGQLGVVQVADLILGKLLATLRAEWAELRLADTDLPIQLGSTPHLQLSSIGAPQSCDEHRMSTTLCSGGHMVGHLVLLRSCHAAPFSSGDRKLLDAIGSFVATAIHNAQLRQQVDTDALTGLANHRAIQERLDDEIDVARSRGQTLGILILDIDDFKLFNDTYGHLAGDQILRVTSQILQAACRENDVVGRYAGDEFVMLLPGADSTGIAAVARRILTSMTRHAITLPGQEPLSVALSIGSALFPDDATSRHDLLSRADAALYEAKRRGGNDARCFQEGHGHIRGIADTTTTFSALQGLVNAVDAKDRYTGEHSEVVTEGALLLARRLGLPSETCSALRIAGLLHDVGKIGIPDHILRKPGRLTAEEYAIMQQHVLLSELIVKDLPHQEEVLAAIAHHHERYDGRGYPRGVRGEDIPLLGRIMALADTCSAMLVSRPYRKGMTWPEVVAELRRGAGTQFDPALVEPFIEAVQMSSLVRDTVVEYLDQYA